MWRLSSDLLLALLVLSGCATLSTRQAEYLRMDQKAEREGFQKIYLSAPPFSLTGYYRSSSPSDTLAVYIEGDGLSWLNRHQPSQDPTPRHPLAFELAAQDTSPSVLYLARPGQYEAGGRPSVDPSYWRGKRFSEEVVQAVNAAIETLKRKLGASRISLAGYSGGGTVAALVAARRSDVVALRTVAGNLSTDTFCRIHQVTPLQGSLDPLAVAASLKDIPQRHFVGQGDAIVPARVVTPFLDEEGDLRHERLTVVAGTDHRQGWPERWRRLLALPLK